MYIEMYTFKVGNFKFTVELDTGAEVGEHQLILWYSEKKDITTIPLKEIESTLLLKALKEPYYSQFTYTLKENAISTSYSDHFWVAASRKQQNYRPTSNDRSNSYVSISRVP